MSAISSTSPSALTVNPPTSLASFVLLGLPRSTADQQQVDHLPTPRLPAHSLIDVDDGRKAVSVKPALIGAIEEVIDELETVYENVAKNARDHIHSEYVAQAIKRDVY